MKKMVLRCLAGLLAIGCLITGYGYYTEPVGSDGRILGMFSMISCCIIALHHVITGSRKLFFPRFSFKKKDK